MGKRRRRKPIKRVYTPPNIPRWAPHQAREIRPSLPLHQGFADFRSKVARPDLPMVLRCRQGLEECKWEIEISSSQDLDGRMKANDHFLACKAKALAREIAERKKMERERIK